MMPDPASFQAIGWLSLAAFCIAKGINEVMTLFGRIKGKPLPEQLAGTTEELSRKVDDLSAKVEESNRDNAGRRRVLYVHVDQKMESLRQEFITGLGKIDTKADERASHLHDRINDLLHLVGQLQGKVLQ